MKYNSNMFRIGIGQDSHKFSNNKKPLILGGVKLSETGGFKANSDGDVILHSLCNALSSSIGGDSISTWSEEMCLKQNIIDSKEYVKVVFKRVTALKYNIVNVSISIEAKKPRFSMKNINKIKKTLSDILEIPIDCVGITFTSGEKLSEFGKGKGIQVFCAVLLNKNG